MGLEIPNYQLKTNYYIPAVLYDAFSHIVAMEMLTFCKAQVYKYQPVIGILFLCALVVIVGQDPAC